MKPTNSLPTACEFALICMHVYIYFAPCACPYLYVYTYFAGPILINTFIYLLCTLCMLIFIHIYILFSANLDKYI
jgi:hypothetical protein